MEETNDTRTEISDEYFDFADLFLTEENDFTVTLGTSDQNNVNVSSNHSIRHDSEVMNDARTVLGEDFDFLDLPFEKDYDFRVTSETSEQNKINVSSDQPITHDSETMNDTRTEISGENFDFIDLTLAKENFPATSETSEKNRKIKVLSDEPIIHDSKAHKRSRTEMRDEVTLPFTEQGSINPDLEASAKTSQAAWYNNCLIVVTIESPNLKESHFKNKSLQKQEDLDGTRNSTIVQNARSNINSYQNGNSRNKVSVSEESKGKNAYPFEDTPAVPRPSCSGESTPQENLENIPRLIEQTVEEMKKTSICLACEHKISKHFKEEEEIFYKCCKCKYRNVDQDFLLRHICREHLSEPFFCKTCQVRYAKVGSHESYIQCNACKENFQCITQLEDHYHIHEEHHIKKCRMCQTDIDEHRIKLEEGVFYKCCCKKCEGKFKKKYQLRLHLYSHSDMNIFKCEYCGERCNLKSSLQSHINTHPKCKICEERFIDKNSLDAHTFREH